jgi:hypothetical protein
MHDLVALAWPNDIPVMGIFGKTSRWLLQGAKGTGKVLAGPKLGLSQSLQIIISRGACSRLRCAGASRGYERRTKPWPVD